MHASAEWIASARASLARRLDSADLVRAGLVGGTVTLAAGAFATLLFMADGSPWPGAAGPESAGAPLEQARLPRARPAEPAMTGSIRAAPPEGAAETTPPPLASNLRFNDLQTRAILIASSWSECDEVENSELFELPDGAPDEILIRIHCANGTRFVLGEGDILANRIVPATPPAETIAAVPPPASAQTPVPTLYEPATAPTPAAPSLTDADILRACEEQVRLGLPFPDSLSRAYATTGVSRLPNGAVVTFDFNALNGFGFPLFMRAECVIENREVARLELTPR
jgi:hypothetical protein